MGCYTHTGQPARGCKLDLPLCGCGCGGSRSEMGSLIPFAWFPPSSDFGAAGAWFAFIIRRDGLPDSGWTAFVHVRVLIWPDAS
jgi:hypothetical protein